MGIIGKDVGLAAIRDDHPEQCSSSATVKRFNKQDEKVRDHIVREEPVPWLHLC